MIYRSRGAPVRAQAGMLVHDELGRASIHAGETRWETAFSPVFERRGKVLVPVAFHATTVGDPADTVPPASLPEKVRTAMHRANLAHSDAEGLCYMESWEAGSCRSAFRLEGLVAAAQAAFMPESDLVIDMAQGDGENCLASVRAIRDAGIAISIRIDNAAIPHRIELADGSKPDMVRLGNEWAGWLSTVPGADAILRSIIATYAEAGIPSFLDGISDHRQLRLAAEAGARWLQGPHLGAPVVAGRLANWRSLNLQAAIGQDASVVMLRR